MQPSRDLTQLWNVLPIGARVAFEEQWGGLAAGGLPCGSAVVNASGDVVAAGRNHVYDRAGEVATRTRYALQHTRLAHAELNALAAVPSDIDHAALTLWTTQHPCTMCAAALAFVGIGSVRFIADDPSDDAPPETIVIRRGEIPYQSLGDPLWWTISNLLFLYNATVSAGADARNVRRNRDRYPALVNLTLDLADRDALGEAARLGTALPVALQAYFSTIARVAEHSPRQGEQEVT